jgi:sulfur-oxidizing protein SoxY
MTTRRTVLSHAAGVAALTHAAGVAALTHSARVAALLLGVGALPLHARAQAGPFNTAAFDAKSMADAVKAFGASTPTESKDVMLTAPDIAENGAVVPVGVSTSLPNAKQLMLLVEKNPNALAASFAVTPAIEANVQTRVKMGQSSNVYAVVITDDGKTLFAQKEVKVTLGGCGG